MFAKNTKDQVELQRTQETKLEWGKAKRIANKFGIQSNFSFHQDHGFTYGDGYLYPSLNLLEKILEQLDKANIGYDNIDLPNNAPKELIARLQQKYPMGHGVMINVNNYP